MDYSQWLKDETAAGIIGCSTKTLRKFADQKKIETGKYQNPDTGAWQTRYNPEDAQKLRRERNPNSAPFVLPPDNDVPGKKMALQRAEPADIEILTRALLKSIAAPKNGKNGILSPSELKHKLYLNAEEAVAYTGLSIAEIRRGINGKGPHPNSRRGPVQSEVFRRRDLEAL